MAIFNSLQLFPSFSNIISSELRCKSLCNLEIALFIYILNSFELFALTLQSTLIFSCIRVWPIKRLLWRLLLDFKHQPLSPFFLSSFHLILQSPNWQQVSSKLSFCQYYCQWNISPKSIVINSFHWLFSWHKNLESKILILPFSQMLICKNPCNKVGVTGKLW